MTNPQANQSDQYGELLTARQTAMFLGVSETSLRNWHDSGKLPRPVRPAKSKRWRKNELLAWCARGCPHQSEWTWTPPDHNFLD